MHICFLNMPIEYYSPVSGGAISTIIMETARELMVRGHDVTVLTITGDDDVYDAGVVIPIRAAARGNLSFLQRRLSGLRRRIHRWDWPYFEHYAASFSRALKNLSPTPDAVILFNDFISPLYVKKVLAKSQVLVWLQNEQSTNRKDPSRLWRSIDHFLTCSSYIRDWTAGRYGIPLDRFTVAHSGVDLAAFRPRQDFLDSSDILRVLFIGRIDPNKGPDIAADAVAALRSEGLPVQFTVAGGLWFYGHGGEIANPFFRKLKDKMDAAGADYLGHVTRHDIPALIRSHDLVCVLSRSNEPFGLVVLESMASGCAVIASDRGGLPEACGGAAILVNPDDLGEVTEVMRRLATDLAWLSELKQRSVQRASEASWERCAGVVESAILAGMRRGSP